eukprot:CAMPEP_0184296510 /NCGR_PEP_ID=MMETSP1049-20130417/7481_1 /TAXON_ID=77928 /ORGANISM="Proteomonas sulcata, Strain CCMP704" /LENGTH=71 /DNA_ID=CAMNT_0026605789 /DNA_START=536 /DNA_END=751 /DNA_ORIENTATION=-
MGMSWQAWNCKCRHSCHLRVGKETHFLVIIRVVILQVALHVIAAAGVEGVTLHPVVRIRATDPLALAAAAI